MKIAVMSDIHGNYVALERCIEYALGEGIWPIIPEKYWEMAVEEMLN